LGSTFNLRFMTTVPPRRYCWQRCKGHEEEEERRREKGKDPALATVEPGVLVQLTLHSKPPGPCRVQLTLHSKPPGPLLSVATPLCPGAERIPITIRGSRGTKHAELLFAYDIQALLPTHSHLGEGMWIAALLSSARTCHTSAQ